MKVTSTNPCCSCGRNMSDKAVDESFECTNCEGSFHHEGCLGEACTYRDENNSSGENDIAICKKCLKFHQEVCILHHTLGTEDGKESYRNYFCTGKTHHEMPILNRLVKKRLMTRRKDKFCENGFVFHVTENGKKLLNNID